MSATDKRHVRCRYWNTLFPKGTQQDIRVVTFKSEEIKRILEILDILIRQKINMTRQR